MSVCLSVRWQKMALLVLRRVGLCVGQNQMCHLCGGNKIELKKCAVGKIKKYRRVGNECRLTRCPFSIWSVCWSPVKMVCPCVNVHFLVVRVNGCCVVLHLPVTVGIRIVADCVTLSCQVTQKLKRAASLE